MDEFTSELKDLPNTREVKHNGTTYTLERHDPYGFWFVKPPHPKTKLPASIAGAFTSPDLAQEAIQQNIRSTPKE